ncbi:hypothetical protein, partial [Paenibacillus larvae]|uniref:hypothetical protein n=1 Tax=Paenibacillus larvae TaxID=1464 RepID=UPI0022820237
MAIQLNVIKSRISLKCVAFGGNFFSTQPIRQTLVDYTKATIAFLSPKLQAIVTDLNDQPWALWIITNLDTLACFTPHLMDCSLIK